MAEVVRVDFAPDWRRQLQVIGEIPLRLFADRVLDAMQRELPASKEGSYGREAGYARSRLSTLERGRMTTGDPYRDVGTDATTPGGDSYPAMLHFGTKAHEIVPLLPGYPLRDPRTGRVFGYKVNHPGTKPTYWGTRAAMSINGQRVYL